MLKRKEYISCLVAGMIAISPIIANECGAASAQNSKSNYVKTVKSSKTIKSKVNKNEVKKVKNAINSLPKNIKLGNKKIVINTRKMYNKLNKQEKALVTNLNKLTKAEAKIKQLEKLSKDKASAKAVQSKIASLNRQLSYDDSPLVRNIRSQYEALNKEAKLYVTNLNVLVKAEQNIQSILNQVHTALKLINSIPELVTLENKLQIEQARKAYDNLNSNDKKRIPSFAVSILIEAESEIERLELIRDNKDVQDIILSIDSLPALDKITMDNKEEVFEIIEKYKALSNNLKYTINTSSLLKALDKIEGFMVEDVIKEIEALPSVEEITLDYKEKVEKVREMFNKISERNIRKVKNMDKLHKVQLKIIELYEIENPYVEDASF